MKTATPKYTSKVYTITTFTVIWFVARKEAFRCGECHEKFEKNEKKGALLYAAFQNSVASKAKHLFSNMQIILSLKFSCSIINFVRSTNKNLATRSWPFLVRLIALLCQECYAY